MTMVIKKTSIAIEESEWTDWLTYAIKKTGSSRKASDLLAEAMKEYKKNHPLEG